MRRFIHPIVTQSQIPSKQTVQKKGRIPRSKLVDVHGATHHEVPTVQRVETTVGGPKMQFGNELVARKASGRPQVRDETAEVARVIPQERVKTAGERASVRERVRQFEVEVLRADPGDR